MKIFTKEFYIFSGTKDLTIAEIRKQLLAKMLVFLVVFITGTLVMGAIEAFHLGQTVNGFFYLSLIVPILIVLVFRKKIPYKFGVLIFLFIGYATGIINIIDYGFSGAGMPIFFSISILATFLVGVRAGFITVFSCVVPMIIIAYLMTSSIIEPIVDFTVIMHNPISWATFIVVMVCLTSIMIVGYGIIQVNLQHSLTIVRKQADDLKMINAELQEDIAHSKKIQEELEISKLKAEESDRLKTAFLNNISHEFRTPMNGIIGFSDLLNYPGITGEQQKTYTAIIKKNSYQLLDILTNMVDISQIQSNSVIMQKTTCNLNSILNETIQTKKLSAETKGLEFTLDVDCTANHFELLTDPQKLSRSIKHLVENAIKFTEQGFVYISCNKTETDLQIIIKDSGIGIPEDMREKIFEPFQQEEFNLTRKYGGAGVGLAIVKSYMDMLNGTVMFESEINKGTTVTLSLPIANSN